MTSYKFYKITNRLNGKIYIGQTKQTLEKRFMQHLHTDSPLGQAMRQCGADNFTIEVIEYCENQEQLNEREKFWIKVLNCKVPNGYNLADGGYGYVRKAAVAMLTVAESLKRFRKKFNLKQKDVADKLGVTPQAYQVYESKVTPSASIIIKIATAFDISADYLLGLTDKPRPLDFPDENPVSETIDIAALQSKVNKIESVLSAKGIKI